MSPPPAVTAPRVLALTVVVSLRGFVSVNGDRHHRCAVQRDVVVSQRASSAAFRGLAGVEIDDDAVPRLVRDAADTRVGTAAVLWDESPGIGFGVPRYMPAVRPRRVFAGRRGPE